MKTLILLLLSCAAALCEVMISPAVPVFTGTLGGPNPTAITVTVTTTNGASWQSFDTCSFFDAGPTSGPSGGSHSLVPSGGWSSLPIGTHSCPITYSAAGNASKTVQVTAIITAAEPTPEPTPTPVPTPTPEPFGCRITAFTNGQLAHFRGFEGGPKPGPVSISVFTPDGAPWTTSVEGTLATSNVSGGISGGQQVISLSDEWDALPVGWHQLVIRHQAPGHLDSASALGVLKEPAPVPAPTPWPQPTPWPEPTPLPSPVPTPQTWQLNGTATRDGNTLTIQIGAQ